MYIVIYVGNHLCSIWGPTCEPEESVYGKREGALQGLCVVSNNPKNIFRQTRGFKTGVVHSISMLQRSEMVKPDHVS